MSWRFLSLIAVLAGATCAALLWLPATVGFCGAVLLSLVWCLGIDRERPGV